MSSPALPPAIARQGLDVRLLLPGYPRSSMRFRPKVTVTTVGPAFGAATLALRFGMLRGVDVPAYVIDAPALFWRTGHPYIAPDGRDWADNTTRFAALGWFAAHLGSGDIDRAWRPAIVHGHDWHAALACAYLALNPAAPCHSVFTIHNLAFQGLFPPDLMAALQLPARLFAFDGLEFYGQGSAMKAAIQYADRITTVSPSYAREIARASSAVASKEHSRIARRTCAASSTALTTRSGIRRATRTSPSATTQAACPARLRARQRCSARWACGKPLMRR